MPLVLLRLPHPPSHCIDLLEASCPDHLPMCTVRHYYSVQLLLLLRLVQRINPLFPPIPYIPSHVRTSPSSSEGERFADDTIVFSPSQHRESRLSGSTVQYVVAMSPLRLARMMHNNRRVKPLCPPQPPTAPATATAMMRDDRDETSSPVEGGGTLRSVQAVHCDAAELQLVSALLRVANCVTYCCHAAPTVEIAEASIASHHVALFVRRTLGHHYRLQTPPLAPPGRASRDSLLAASPLPSQEGVSLCDGTLELSWDDARSLVACMSAAARPKRWLGTFLRVVDAIKGRLEDTTKQDRTETGGGPSVAAGANTDVLLHCEQLHAALATCIQDAAVMVDADQRHVAELRKAAASSVVGEHHSNDHGVVSSSEPLCMCPPPTIPATMMYGAPSPTWYRFSGGGVSHTTATARHAAATNAAALLSALSQWADDMQAEATVAARSDGGGAERRCRVSRSPSPAGPHQSSSTSPHQAASISNASASGSPGDEGIGSVQSPAMQPSADVPPMPPSGAERRVRPQTAGSPQREPSVLRGESRGGRGGFTRFRSPRMGHLPTFNNTSCSAPSQEAPVSLAQSVHQLVAALKEHVQMTRQFVVMSGVRATSGTSGLSDEVLLKSALEAFLTATFRSIRVQSMVEAARGCTVSRETAQWNSTAAMRQADVNRVVAAIPFPTVVLQRLHQLLMVVTSGGQQQPTRDAIDVVFAELIPAAQRGSVGQGVFGAATSWIKRLRLLWHPDMIQNQLQRAARDFAPPATQPHPAEEDDDDREEDGFTPGAVQTSMSTVAFPLQAAIQRAATECAQLMTKTLDVFLSSL